MKVKLEFDSATDPQQIILLAVRAEGIYHLVEDLLNQLRIWTAENPNDEQGKAFEKVHQWLCDQIPSRGYYISEENRASLVNRAGNPVSTTHNL